MPNINIDLIAGLSGQTEASWRESLDWIERLVRRTSRSTCWRWTRTAASARRCCSAACATAPPKHLAKTMTADFYEIAVERLAAVGSRATRSRISRGPGGESRHNLKYWQLEPYVGFGADAHSFDGELRSSERGIGCRITSSRRTGGSRTTAAILRRRAVLRRPAADGRHPPAAGRVGALSRSHPAVRRMRAAGADAATRCASPAAASCSPTKSFRSS